jgi:hypothetical protein
MKHIKVTAIVFTVVFPILSFSQSANITSHDHKEISSSKRYSITIHYPQVDFGPGALMGVRGIASEINHCVDTLAQNQINDFKNILKDLPNEPCGQGYSGLEISYKTIFSNSKLFSFLFVVYSGPDCSNHPYTYSVSLNYSTLSTGAFSISDIFTPGTDWLKFISDHCIKVLKKKALDDGLQNSDEQISIGAGPDAYNFRVFNIDDKALTITFNPYWVGPYIWGAQPVTIPLSDLKGMIDPVGPAGELIK